MAQPFPAPELRTKTFYGHEDFSEIGSSMQILKGKRGRLSKSAVFFLGKFRDSKEGVHRLLGIAVHGPMPMRGETFDTDTRIFLIGCTKVGAQRGSLRKTQFIRLGRT